MFSLWQSRLWHRVPSLALRILQDSCDKARATCRLLCNLSAIAVVAAPLLQGCAAIPKVELRAYATAYAETQVITNGVLDIVVPYERAIIRNTARDPGIGGSASNSRAATILAAAPIAVPAPCPGRRGEVFCYEIRAGYADIGDPPLVGAFRNLSNVVARFNALLVAYADGVSAKLIEQELSGLAVTVTTISSFAPAAGTSAAAVFANRFNNLVGKIANIAGPIIDREQLRSFLLDNYELVDEAIVLMATSSPVLNDNVANGTRTFLLLVREREALRIRAREIRRLIANWTVLLDDNRRLLRELKIAVEASDGLETRLRNLNESTVIARIDTSAIKKQIATLGTPILPP